MRKLAITACFFSAAIAVSQYLLPGLAALLCAAGSAAALAVSVLLKKGKAVRAAAGLCLGFIWSCSWQRLFLREAMSLDGTRAVIEAEVLEPMQESGTGVQTQVRIGGTRCILYLYGETDTALVPGELIRVDAKLLMRDEDNGYMAQGIPLFAYAQSPPVITGTAPLSLRTAGALIRARVGTVIDTIYSGTAAPFMKALLLGDRRELKEEIYTYSMMKTSGVSHCVAVSGMHVSILVGLIYFLLGSRRLAAAVCIPVAVLFMAVTGFTPSVVRSGIMQIIMCVSALTLREYDSRTALMFALALLLAVNPCSIKNVSLQLSFAASLGIILFYNRFNVIRIKYVGSTLAVTAGALVFTVPITAVTFGSMSLIAPVTNILVLWAVSLCFSFGILSAAAGVIYAPAGAAAAVLPELLCGYIRRVSTLCGMLPFASVGTGSTEVKLWLVLMYAVLIWFLADRRKFPKAVIFTCLYAAGAAAVIFVGRHGMKDAVLRFAALDVGQGQCTVITTDECTVVIDCGGSGYTNAGDIAADYLHLLGRNTVDLLILTHFHSDHVNGAIELMKRTHVSALAVCPGDDTGISRYAEEEEGAETAVIEGGVKRFTYRGMDFLLVPPDGYSDENENGLCVLCSYGDFDVLMTGDMSSSGELELLEKADIPDIEILVVGHHGSSTSCAKELLERTAPEAAVISVGRNSYGHPTKKVLDRIAEAGITCLRTDELGSVIITYDGAGDYE